MKNAAPNTTAPVIGTIIAQPNVAADPVFLILNF
jgi:hypothetical protein